MRQLLATILLISMLCTSVTSVSAYGAEDPCGKGCPLIEKDVWSGDDKNQGVMILYLYECGNKVEDYFQGVLQAYAIYNYSEDTIQQYIRLENGSYKFNRIPIPVRQILDNPSALESVIDNTEDDGYQEVKSGGFCAYAPNYKCNLYIKPFNGEKVLYETFAWDIVAGMAAATVIAYLTTEFTGLKIPMAGTIATNIVKLLNGDKVNFDSQHNLRYDMYDAIDMCRGIVNETCVQETIYKKEQHRVYYTHRGILIDDLVSVIGQYDKEEEFMSYCIGRYYNEYHSPNHTYLYKCSKICKECGGGNRSASHEYLAATCTSPKSCKWCSVTDGEPLGHTYAFATCNAPKICIRCKATSGSPLGHSYSAATCTSAEVCTRCGVTSGSALGHSYSGATCTSAATCIRCGATSGSALGHNYNAATCTSAKKCTRCGAASGSPLGHNYSAATCTSANKCTRCGATSGSALGHNYSAATCTSAKKCTRCGATSGSPLGHNYSAATCTSAKKCARCGATSGSALGHSYGSWSFFDKNYHIRTCSRCKISEKGLHKIVALGCGICGWKGEIAIAKVKKLNSILVEEIAVGE